MKRSGLLHPELLAAIGELGHLDEMLICDAGYPIPADVPRIDLAYRSGRPPFIDVLEAVLAEVIIDGAIIATEASPELAGGIQSLCGSEPRRMAHAALKERARGVRVAVRTGELPPYANVLLVCGVVFQDR